MYKENKKLGFTPRNNNQFSDTQIVQKKLFLQKIQLEEELFILF